MIRYKAANATTWIRDFQPCWRAIQYKRIFTVLIYSRYMFEEAFVGEEKSLYQISTPKMELILERERLIGEVLI